VVFVDGGNSFDPYSVAEIARNYGLDSRAVLERIYVSRAFTAYQLSSLILEELESAVNTKSRSIDFLFAVSSSFFNAFFNLGNEICSIEPISFQK
jgi:hypothetical protein